MDKKKIARELVRLAKQITRERRAGGLEKDIQKWLQSSRSSGLYMFLRDYLGGVHPDKIEDIVWKVVQEMSKAAEKVLERYVR